MDIPCIWTRSIIFRWQPHSIYVAPPSMNHADHHSHPCHSSHPPFCFWLLFTSVLAEPPANHIIGSFTTTSSITSVHQKGPAQPHSSYHFGKRPWNVVEKRDNGHFKWRQGATQRPSGCHQWKLDLRHDLAQFNASSSLTSMLASKRTMLIHLERFIKIIHQLSRNLHTPP